MNYTLYSLKQKRSNNINNSSEKDQKTINLIRKRGALSIEEAEIVNNSESEPVKESAPRWKVSDAIKWLKRQCIEYTPGNETASCHREEIICDHYHIEGQRINIVYRKDLDKVEFWFKLRTRNETIETLIAKLESEIKNKNQTEVTMPNGTILRRGSIIYKKTYSSRQYPLCDAYVLEKGDGVRTFIANPTSRCNTRQENLIRTALSLIKVEIPSSIDSETTEQILKEILEKDLGVPDALSEVSEDAEREYKTALYKWHYLITGELTSEQIEEVENLKLKEVFPGYWTYVQEGKHKEYLAKYGKDTLLIHYLNTGDAKSIYRILTQGLMSTTERGYRGILRRGMSSPKDIISGGADNVFTRISKYKRSDLGTMVILKPETFDRMDWFSYDFDTYGSTDDRDFAIRLSPDAILATTTSSDNIFFSNNEQMFRTGIGPNFIESIIVDPPDRDAIITELRSWGLKEVNGKPIEEIILSYKRRKDESI